jgi:hypothetical protein
MLRVPLVASLVELATGQSCACPGGARRRPPQAWPQLLGHDLHDRAGAAVLGGPAPLLELAHDHDAAALRQGLGCMLGLVAPDDDGEERRLLLSPVETATRNMARAMPPSVCHSSGLLGCRVGWSGRLRAGVGHARNRPASSLHPGRGGSTRLPPRELLAARPRRQPHAGGDLASSRRSWVIRKVIE